MSFDLSFGEMTTYSPLSIARLAYLARHGRHWELVDSCYLPHKVRSKTHEGYNRQAMRVGERDLDGEEQALGL